MAWFKHQHYWRYMKCGPLLKAGSQQAIGSYQMDDCRCGVIRAVEYTPGSAPTIRIANPLNASETEGKS
jgi:hypothetical protein